jgi:hypothetical protein
MTSFEDNKLLLNNIANNPFLQNHPLFKKPQHLLTPDEHAKLTEINRHLERIKHDFERKASNIDKPNERNKLVEKIIEPVKIPKKNKLERVTIDNYKEDLSQLWKQRTNQPYKNILKNENYNREFKSKEDLIVHKVTHNDKHGLDETFDKFKQVLTGQNDEIRTIYSQSKKTDHLKQFEYNHKYKYRIQTSSHDHDDIKSDTLQYFKKEQEKQEQEKVKVDQIIDSMLSSGILEPIPETSELEDVQLERPVKPSVNRLNGPSKGIRTIKRM